jgi:uncharacterized alkaline shock family protein YloU
MEGQRIVAPDVLARYAGDAACEVDGVTGLADGALHRAKPVEINGEADALEIVIHLELGWGDRASEVGSAVQTRVAEYLTRMTNAAIRSIDVVFARVAPPDAER